MMRCVLTEDLSAVLERALESLSQDRVEGLVLARADVQTAHREGNHLLEALEVVRCFRGLL